MQSSKQTTIIVVVLVIGVALFMFKSMSGSSSAGSNLVNNTNNSFVETDSERKIMKLLKDVQSITLDNAIFKDPAFSSLRDFSRKIVVEPSGRDNPFDARIGISTNEEDEVDNTQATTQEGVVPNAQADQGGTPAEL